MVRYWFLTSIYIWFTRSSV